MQSNASIVTPVVIATRESRLALWQAEHVRDRLQQELGLPTELPPNVKGALGAYWRRRQSCAPEAAAGG